VEAFKKGVLSVGPDQFDLGSDAVVVFLHVPRTADENDRQRYDRGVDHHTSIMKLCEPEGRIEVHNPLENDPLPFKLKAQEFEYYFAAPVLKCARQDKAKAKTPTFRDAGYPSCSSRRMKL
jgi:hypothetical protein